MLNSQVNVDVMPQLQPTMMNVDVMPNIQPLMLSAHVMPQLVLEGESLPTLWTPVGLDVVVHIHVVLKILLPSDALPANTTHVKVLVQMHAIPVSIHWALKSEGRVTEITHKQRLGLTAIFLARCSNGCSHLAWQRQVWSTRRLSHVVSWSYKTVGCSFAIQYWSWKHTGSVNIYVTK